MSAVLQRAKQFYCKAMIVELAICLSFTLFIAMFAYFEHAFSFFLGCIVSFLPQCVFIYWVFFRKNSQRVTAFYRAEGVKWGTTIVLIVLVLKTVVALNIVLFFAGYFLCLLYNGVFPFFLNRQKR